MKSSVSECQQERKRTRPCPGLTGFLNIGTLCRWAASCVILVRGHCGLCVLLLWMEDLLLYRISIGRREGQNVMRKNSGSNRCSSYPSDLGMYRPLKRNVSGYKPERYTAFAHHLRCTFICMNGNGDQIVHGIRPLQQSDLHFVSNSSKHCGQRHYLCILE